MRDAGNLTVSELRNSAHGEGGTAPLEEFVWQVSEWRDGRVVRWQMYESEQDAIEAAGPSSDIPHAVSPDGEKKGAAP